MSDKAPRINKWITEIIIQGSYGCGWEDVDCDWDTVEGRKRIRENFRLYRENEPQYSHRTIRRRVLNPAHPDYNPANDPEANR